MIKLFFTDKEMCHCDKQTNNSSREMYYLFLQTFILEFLDINITHFWPVLCNKKQNHPS